MISSFFRRLLGLLFTFGIYKHHLIITYTGEICSTNKIYSSPHFSVRSKLKEKYHKIFSSLLKAQVPPTFKMTEMSLVVFVNTRLDIDNHIQNKFLCDVLKMEYIAEDSTKFYKSTHTIHDPSLPKNTCEYHIIAN